jgi:hypothetical protein
VVRLLRLFGRNAATGGGGAQAGGAACGRRAAAFDVTRDGQRFLVVRPAGASAQGGNIVAVQNWFTEFQGAKKD